MSLCLMTEACVSVFYRRQHRRCQLHDVLFMSPQDGQEEAGTVYYSLSSGTCPPGYIHNRLLNVCYQLHPDKISYIEGLADCRSRGEHFLVIDSPDKQSHFVKQVTASTDSKTFGYYIDGSDVATEGQWVYHDSRPMTYFAWAPGCPENRTANKDYIVASKYNAFRWRDRVLTSTKYYACEKDV
ncbi:perlucin-like [Haliotis rubra]|uniref:perlucin-like n=1 Tax=Haliotis rubra TaxID=36100 RepID=UPI001EE5ABD9|nr:perlucin-like [Haliotis rubra]